jgi:hypothetical protein
MLIIQQHYNCKALKVLALRRVNANCSTTLQLYTFFCYIVRAQRRVPNKDHRQIGSDSSQNPSTARDDFNKKEIETGIELNLKQMRMNQIIN